MTLKTQEVRKTLTNENFKVEEEMKRHYAHQKTENSRLQQQVTALRGEKTALDMQLIELERRMAEVELATSEFGLFLCCWQYRPQQRRRNNLNFRTTITILRLMTRNRIKDWRTC